MSKKGEHLIEQIKYDFGVMYALALIDDDYMIITDKVTIYTLWSQIQVTLQHMLNFYSYEYAVTPIFAIEEVIGHYKKGNFKSPMTAEMLYEGLMHYNEEVAEMVQEAIEQKKEKKALYAKSAEEDNADPEELKKRKQRNRQYLRRHYPEMMEAFKQLQTK